MRRSEFDKVKQVLHLSGANQQDLLIANVMKQISSTKTKKKIMGGVLQKRSIERSKLKANQDLIRAKRQMTKMLRKQGCDNETIYSSLQGIETHHSD